jgi:hypothetical protein
MPGSDQSTSRGDLMGRRFPQSLAWMAKTEKRDLATAEQRLKQVQQRLREEQRNEKQSKQQAK